MTMQQTFNEFILSRKLAGLSKKTIAAYTDFVFPFVQRFPEKALEELTQEDVNCYLLELLARNLAKATQSTYIRHVKIFLKWAADNYSVAYDYRRIKVPRMPKKQVLLYSDREILCIFETVRKMYGDSWLCIRNQAIIALMLDSGLRQSETVSLLWKDVRPDSIIVTGKGDKQRMVPLGKMSSELLLSYREASPYSGSSRTVFVSRTGCALTSNAVKLFMAKVADKLPFEFGSHRLRHNFATNYCLDQYALNGSIDIYRLMSLMGHENLSTTKRYLHIAYGILAAQNNISHLDRIFK